MRVLGRPFPFNGQSPARLQSQFCTAEKTLVSLGLLLKPSGRKACGQRYGADKSKGFCTGTVWTCLHSFHPHTSRPLLQPLLKPPQLQMASTPGQWGLCLRQHCLPSHSWCQHLKQQEVLDFWPAAWSGSFQSLGKQP